VTSVRDRAVTAMARIIEANRESDAHVVALECLAAAEGLGYRPVEALVPVSWPLRGGGTGLPSESVRAELDAALALAAEDAAERRRNDPPKDAA
jgi:hypothetical protein